MNVHQLITQPESDTLDFKRDLSSLSKVVKTILAISNTANGVVIVGIDNRKTVVGLTDPLQDDERLSRAVADSIKPLLLVSINHATVAGKALLVIEVPFSPRPYYLVAEGFPDGVYVRESSTNTKADAATVEELQRQGAIQSFDMETIPAVEASALDFARIRAAFGKKLPLSKLQTLGIAADHTGHVVATHAGVILFGTDEQRRIHAHDSALRCAAFRGTSKSEFLDRAPEFDGITVLEGLGLYESFIARNTREGSSFGQGIRRRNIHEYHPDALRELMVNAIAHANYASAGTPISVQLFTNRIEIINPGRFPPGTTVQSLKNGFSKVRNRGIADVLHQLDIMETWGSGWDRIQATFTDGYPEPTWEQVGGSVKVTLPVHPHFSETTTPVRARRATPDERKQEVLAFIASRELVSRDDVAGHLNISRRKAGDYLNSLVEEGIARRTLPTRSPQQRYELV